MRKIIWLGTGTVEELDKKQIRLLDLVYGKIRFYYNKLYKTRPCYKYPLSLHRLMKLTERNSYRVGIAIRYLAHTVPLDSGQTKPLIRYYRVSSTKNKSHRPYRIYLNE